MGSGNCHALAGRNKFKACGAVLSTDGKYPKVAEGLSMPLRLLTTTCLGGLRSPWPGRAYPLGTGDGAQAPMHPGCRGKLCGTE